MAKAQVLLQFIRTFMEIVREEGIGHAGPGYDRGGTHAMGAIDQYGKLSYPDPLSSTGATHVWFFFGL